MLHLCDGSCLSSVFSGLWKKGELMRLIFVDEQPWRIDSQNWSDSSIFIIDICWRKGVDGTAGRRDWP